jgi:hypothetical protein
MSDTILGRGERIALITGGDLNSAAKMALDDLVGLLHRTLESVVLRRIDDPAQADVDEDFCIMFGAPEDCPPLARMAKETKLDLSAAALGEEGCVIACKQTGDKTVLVLGGATAQGACHAVYSFLENELGIGFFIDGDRVPELDFVDLADLDRVETPAVPRRAIFHHSAWKFPYSACWRLWGFDRWKEIIDWMRHKRFSQVPLFHDEGTYLWGDAIFQAFPELKKNDETLKEFAVDPVWRTELNKKLFSYIRESGMSVVYNLFFTQVPECFKTAYPDLKYHEMAMYNLGICATQPECKEFMLRYWGKILELYGIDDCHEYHVCSYQHERDLCENYHDRIETSQMTMDVLKQLDPQAKFFFETWCWKYCHEEHMEKRTWDVLEANAGKEWELFNKAMPKDVGVSEWDVKKNHGHCFSDQTFAGRPYVQLIHTNMEGWNPPSISGCNMEMMVDYFDKAIENGASGTWFFHILANESDIGADLAAKIGWEKKPDLDAFYKDYARRRFGEEAADALGESIKAFADCCGSSELELDLTFPGFIHGAEERLKNCKETGAARKKWLEDNLAMFAKHEELFNRALMLARGVSSRVEGDPFFENYVWELDYVAARFEGIQSMFKSHLLAKSDPQQAAALHDRAMDAYFTIVELFSNCREYFMSDIRDVDPDVPYSAAFLKDWRWTGFWADKGVMDSFQIVGENFPIFEKVLQDLRPEGLE